MQPDNAIKNLAFLRQIAGSQNTMNRVFSTKRVAACPKWLASSIFLQILKAYAGLNMRKWGFC